MSDSTVFFICHAGQAISQYKPHNDPLDLEMGVIGAVYGWNGEWIRSPEEVGNRESTTEMFLIGLATGRPCSGTEGCFTQIDSSDELLDWYYDKMGDYIDFKTKREKEMPLV